MKTSRTSLVLQRLFYLLLLPLISAPLMAAEEGVDQIIDQALDPIAKGISKVIFYAPEIQGNELPIVLVVLGGTAIFLTIYFKFINLRSVGLALRTAKGKYTDPNAPGQISHFQALTAALSATVGLGNIAGVAVAVGVGGPGATFWMILMGLCGMTTKFAECTLGVKYRKIDDQGRVRGGAMYYLSRGLGERGLGGLGMVLAILFAIFCIGGALGAGNMFQVNQATSQVTSEFGIFENNKIWFGVILAILVGLVIIGGIVSIARVTSFLVPFMCGMYVIGALAIIFMNIDQVGSAISQIFTGAFSPMAVGGSLIGVLIQGIKRAAFSNEAGVGSAPIAHSAVKTDKPASEGVVALLEPFTDTVVVCTMTALVLIITGAWKVDGVVGKEPLALYKEADPSSLVVKTLPAGSEMRIIGENKDKSMKKVWITEDESLWAVSAKGYKDVSGITKTSRAFGMKFSWFPKLLAVAVLLFAFSTMISWSYYGEQAVIFLCGGYNPAAVLFYKLFFCACVVVGAVSSLGNVITISDSLIFAMVIPNLIGLYFLLPVVRKEWDIFKKHVAETDAKN